MERLNVKANELSRHGCAGEGYTNYNFEAEVGRRPGSIACNTTHICCSTTVIRCPVPYFAKRRHDQDRDCDEGEAVKSRGGQQELTSGQRTGFCCNRIFIECPFKLQLQPLKTPATNEFLRIKIPYRSRPY
ncbi:uncharacterized protein ARMOST_16672 [Armillaria ostoyae]|uniref:Uncharacterized protein n=1 Tax=Armillaria ostoyae TaxID=47428 RepID=A0A284RWU5_ARMOS|nr:uncharacterized protein ARMOST_16672 [Armillaria ostoyae]